ncbi:DUF2087 domain-containing protein [Canibacter oris]|uniref:DUF2087 domain-containing protein n=1 Tax=Canibacter oris TaxID=1365628 RepID=A0A840DPE0_9MICO|nr:DUF2087 domain-containing protein [Canibacter oris]MBB4071967.1 hypothetical protein [Canibacter oris]
MSTETNSRRIVALLANPQTRKVFARLLLGENFAVAASDLKAKQFVKLQAGLTDSAIIDAAGALNESVFAEMLAANPAKKREGIDKWVREGRIHRYPMNPAERRELLQWVARQVLKPGEVINEAEINHRLRQFDDDFPALRRYLIDFELVERTRTGTEYALVTDISAAREWH